MKESNAAMTSGCRSAAGCIDAHTPVRATYVNLYKWPESDAEFVKSVARGSAGRVVAHGKFGPGPAVVDSYSCRQMYLRSYTFSKKESVPEKTRRCLGKVRERAADLPLIGKSANKSRKKSRATGRKLREGSCSAIRSIFHRLLACTSTVDVADRASPE